MLKNNLWFMRSARHDNALDVARDEPSHIHIARPSRLRRDTLAASVEQLSGELPERDPAAAQVTLQAA